MSTQAKGTRLLAVLTPPQQKMHLGLPVDLRLRRSSRRASKRAIGSASAELAAVSISAACSHTGVSALCDGSHDAGLCACWEDGRRGSPWRAVRRADSRSAVPVHAAGDLPVGSEDTGAITCHRRPATSVRARARQGAGRSARTASRARTCTPRTHAHSQKASTATCADGAACTNQGYPILAGLARGWGGNDGNMEEEVTSHSPQCICACTLRVSVADFSRWSFRLRPSGRPPVHRVSLAQTQATPRPLQTAENRGKLASARVPCAVCWCALRTRRLCARCASQRLSPNPRRTPPLH